MQASSIHPSYIFTASEEKLEQIANKQKGCRVQGQKMRPADAPSLTSWLTSQKNPKIIAVYNFKGGVGKTTLTTLTAAGIAQTGKRVLMVDADAQTNLTSFFMPPVTGGDDEEDVSPIQPAPGGHAYFEQVDRIKKKAEQVAPDHKVLDNSLFVMNSISDMNEALSGPFREGDAQLAPPSKYYKPLPTLCGDNLLLIPGSPHLFDYDGTITKSKGADTEIMMHTAFGNLCRMAAYVTDADYVMIDLGPSSSYLNKVMLMSCDYILPPMFPDFFSLSSLHALLHVMLPSVTTELEYLKERRDKVYAKPNDSAASKIKAYGYTYPDALGPTILPFIVTNYRKKGLADRDKDGGAFEDDGDAPAPPLTKGRRLVDPTEDSFAPEWVTNAPGKFIASMRDLIQAFGTTESSTSDQKIVKGLLKPDSDGQMVIPLLRAMPKLMAESQETGIPAVMMTRDWWERTIKPQLIREGLKNEFPKPPELHQLVSDHIYTKVRIQMLVNFLEAL